MQALPYDVEINVIVYSLETIINSIYTYVNE